MNRICIDIGGTAIKYGVIDDTLQFSYEDQRPTQAMLGGQHVVENVIEIVHTLQEKTTAVSVCISTTGIIDPVKGIILEANPALMPSYTGIHIAEADADILMNEIVFNEVRLIYFKGETEEHDEFEIDRDDEKDM